MSRRDEWSDERLVRACLQGDDQAWSALIDRYKNLIYSIPRRYGATPEDAADIFQSVCVELFAELASLRKPAAVRSWLISVTTHQSYHWKVRHRQQAARELVAQDDEEGSELEAAERANVMETVEQAQMIRDAIRQLPPRCQEMIRLLFYTDPPLAYREVARRLGLATGSIGFIRGRCLQRLQKILKGMGF